MQEKPENTRPAPEGEAPKAVLIRKRLENIRRLQGLPRRSKAVLALFVAVSLGAMLHPLYLPELPQGVRAFLGAPPPVGLISLALVVYSFSALILTLGRMTQGINTFRGWSHLGYVTAFYLFYFYTGELGTNFWGVFVAGLSILVLEDYRISNYCREELRKERETMERLERG